MAAPAATTVREFDINTRYTRDTYMSYSDNEEKVGEIEEDFNIIHADMDRTANQNSQNELEYLTSGLVVYLQLPPLRRKTRCNVASF